MIAGSFDLPEQTWKNVIIWITPITIIMIMPAIGTRIVQHKADESNDRSDNVIENLRTCLMWNLIYSEFFVAIKPIIMPHTPKIYIETA